MSVVLAAAIGAAAAVLVEHMRLRHDHRERAAGRRRTRGSDLDPAIDRRRSGAGS